MMRTIFAILMATLTFSVHPAAADNVSYGYGLEPDPHAHVIADGTGVCVTTDTTMVPPTVNAELCSEP